MRSIKVHNSDDKDEKDIIIEVSDEIFNDFKEEYREVGKGIAIEVSDEVFKVFKDECREFEREKKEMERHGSNCEMEDNILPLRSLVLSETPEDQVCLLESLHFALKSCTPNQRIRFHLYLCGYSLTEIAHFQNTSVPAVLYSLKSILKKIKNIFDTP